VRHPLESRIAALRGQVRRHLAAHGLALLVLGAVAAVATAGFLDWSIHLVPEVRLVLLVGVAAAALSLAVRYVLIPLVVRFNDLDIAMRIEGRWPGLNDRLASTVQFLRASGEAAGEDGHRGSKVLRDATVAQTIEETEGIDFRQAIDPRPARRALAWSSVAVGLALSLLVLAPASTRIALERLFLPFTTTQWPRETHLTIVEGETPRKVARGEPFTLAVAVAQGERMPSTARVTYTFADGETAVEPLRPADDGVFRGRLDAANRDFSFAVEAGDDQTAPWDVRVVPPPALTNLTVRLVPPEYTGLPPQSLAPGNTQARTVYGSKVELEGGANKPLASAVLRVGEAPSPSPATVAQDGLAVAARFDATASAPFWFELKDTEGFRNRELVRYDLRVVPDEAPRVTIEEPTTDRDVPARAVVPIRVAVEDDHGIRSIRHVYKVATGGSEPAAEVIVPLWDGQAVAKGGPAPVKSQAVTHRFDLAPLKLEPGAIVSFHADARDFDNVKGPNVGKSREFRLRVVTDEEINRQLEDQQRALRDDIERAHAMQKQAELPVDDALRMLAKTKNLPAPTRENLKNAETIQRQVTGRITGKADGIEAKLTRILDDLANFNVANPEVERQMLAMREAVNRIKDKDLTPAEQNLSRAGKAVDDQADPARKPEPGAQADNPAADGTKPSPGGNPSKPANPTAKPQPGAEARPGVPAKPDDPAGEPKPKAGEDAAKAGDASKGDPAADAAKASDAAKAADGAKPKPGGEPSKPGDGAKPGDTAKPGDGSEAAKAGGDPAKPEGGKPDGAKGGDPSRPKAGAGDPKAAAPELALNDAARNQKAIEDELKKMLDSMGEFSTMRGITKDAKALLQQQEQALKNSAEAAAKPDLAGKAPEALAPEQKGDLENLAARQAELAKLAQNLESKLDEMAKKLEASDPLGASALREAAKQSRSRATAAKMAEAAEQLGKNQMGQGRQNQESARNDLKDLVDSLQNRRERELARLVQELKKAEADLKDLKARQAANLKKAAEARKIADPKAREKELQKLAKEQAEIQKEMKRQLQKLAKLGADAAAGAAEGASAKMAKAEQDLNGDQGEQAEADMEEALDNLRQAQKDLAENRRDAEEQLAMEQISKMADTFKSIAERQEKMIGETTGYEQSRAAAAGKLSIAQRTGVRGLGRVQESLKDETGELIERLGEGAPVFTLTLKRAASAMESAAGRLQALKTDAPTVQAERSASDRFKQLLESLKPDKMKKGGDDGGGGGGGGGGGKGGDGIPASAQIKMLKTLQQEINGRTEDLDEQVRRGKPLAPEQEQERAKLHEDQGALADLVRDLTRPKQPDGED